MEFNQETRSFCTPVAVLDTVAEQLADVDLTLPDYCPDIEKILKCTLIPKIQSKSLSGGQLQIEGVCVVNVMYVESIKKTIRCCEQSVNFSQSFSIKDTPDNPVVITRTKPEYINCRALSPRRLVMHGAFSLYAKVLVQSSVKIFRPSDGELETKRRAVRCADLKSFCQDCFTVCEEISAADKPGVESILHCSADVGITDTKAVTGKLMLNGEINLRMFYLSDVETGETAKIDYILPFSRIIDCEGIDEDAINLVACDVMSYDIRLKNDMLSEKPAVVVDLRLCVTEEGYVINDEEIVTDAYCVGFASQPEFEQLRTAGEISQLCESHMEKITVKADDGKISKILDIYADRISFDSAQSEKGMCVNGKINVCILALNEENRPVFIERSADYEHIFPLSDCNLLKIYSVRASSISYRLADDNTVEIRCELKICGGAMREDKLTAVKNVIVFDDKPIPPESCALTLYFAKEGESLWNIAKAHNTRLDLLTAENSAEKPVLDAPQMLLIPRI